MLRKRGTKLDAFQVSIPIPKDGPIMLTDSSVTGVSHFTLLAPEPNRLLAI